MKTVQFLIISLFVLGAFVAAADAQRRKAPVRRPAAVVRTPVRPAVTSEVILAKTKVANQLSNVNRFIEILGPIAQGIESVDGDAKAKRLPKTVLDQNETNKQKVIQAIRNLKAGLMNLETEFRTKSDLKKYLTNIEGISDLSAQSEDSALAGKFVASKEPLRTIAKKLSDTMAVLP